MMKVARSGHTSGKERLHTGTGLKETCQFMIAKSTDDGLSWSFPDNITAKTKHPEWWLFAPARDKDYVDGWYVGISHTRT
jgi:hypothetical protein